MGTIRGPKPFACGGAAGIFCGSTDLGARSRYVFMVLALHAFAVRGVSFPTPVLRSLLAKDGCGSPREITGSAAVDCGENISRGEAPFTRFTPESRHR
jgi:hypothetical protein